MPLAAVASTHQTVISHQNTNYKKHTEQFGHICNNINFKMILKLFVIFPTISLHTTKQRHTHTRINFVLICLSTKTNKPFFRELKKHIKAC